jgi:prepilin-type N-terminal cleavage/methylation domain-containing protein
MHFNQKNGFTLIELSIVLVIIGLLAGGVLVGRDLIKSAQLRSVISDIDKFNAAANAFKLKYDCIPGDCINATSIFGQFASCGAWNGIDDFGSNTTCNGNGDGKVLQLVPGDPSAFNWWRYDESMLFWHHLMRADLINGKYTGMWSGNGIEPGDVPVSKLDGGCYSINTSGFSTGTQQSPYQMRGMFFAIGNYITYDGTGSPTGDCVAGLYSLPAVSAYYLDNKIDDGKPFTGTVQSLMDLYGGPSNLSSNTPPGCLISTNIADWANYPTNTTYDRAAPSTACQLFFKVQF